MTSIRGILPAAITPLDTAGHSRRPSSSSFWTACIGLGSTACICAARPAKACCSPSTNGKRSSRPRWAARPAIAMSSSMSARRRWTEAVALSSHAAQAGAHAISSLPPMSAPFAFADVLRYYEALAAASDLPLLVYYFPEISSSIATLDQIETLCGLTERVWREVHGFRSLSDVDGRPAGTQHLQRPR